MNNYFENNLDEKNIEKIKKSLFEDGFFVIRDFFNKEQVSHLINYCEILISKNNSEPVILDLIKISEIRKIVFHEKIISLMKTILSEKSIYYFGDSTIHFTPNNRIFHTDARPEGVVENIIDYPLFRIGIYLQDHYNHSGGLKIRKGSHKKMIYNKTNIKGLINKKFTLQSYKSLFNTGKVINLRSKVGDLAIWNIKIEHSGGAVIPKLFPNLAFWPFIDEKIPKIFKKPEHKNRFVVFNALGKYSQALDDYVRFRNMSAKKHGIDPYNKEDYTSEIQKFAENQNIQLYEHPR